MENVDKGRLGEIWIFLSLPFRLVSQKVFRKKVYSLKNMTYKSFYKNTRIADGGERPLISGLKCQWVYAHNLDGVCMSVSPGWISKPSRHGKVKGEGDLTPQCGILHICTAACRDRTPLWNGLAACSLVASKHRVKRNRLMGVLQLLFVVALTWKQLLG